MKNLLLWLPIAVLSIALATSTSQAQGPYRQDTIKPSTCDWPQKGKDDTKGWWCGAASLQAAIDWNHCSQDKTGLYLLN